MGITSINYTMGASWGAYSQKLTQATKTKLDSLGIPYNENISEEEAKKLIKSYEASAKQNANNESNSKNNSSASDLFEKAKKLAQKVGIEVPEGINFQQLIMAIEAKISQRLNANSNNIEALKELKSLSQELAFIQAQSNGSSGYDNTNRVLLASLEMMGEYNKNLLNKNQKR